MMEEEYLFSVKKIDERQAKLLPPSKAIRQERSGD
jgi:hypothetical protein